MDTLRNRCAHTSRDCAHSLSALFSLDSDASDAAILVTPPSLVFDSHLKVFANVSALAQNVLPNHRILPYGSFVTGLMLRTASDLDLTVVGDGHDHHTAVTLCGALRESGDFDVSTRPCLHPTIPPHLRFRHVSSGIEGDITFNQLAAVRTSGLLAAAAQRFPHAASLAVLVKAVVAGAGLPRGAMNSIGISVSSFAVYMTLRDRLADANTRAPHDEPSVAEALLAYTRFFGSEAMRSDPQRHVVSLRGLFVGDATASPFLTWNILDPATGRNVVERCFRVADFSLLMGRLHATLSVHYCLERHTRPEGSAHLLHLVPEFDPTRRLTPPLGGSDAVPTRATDIVEPVTTGQSPVRVILTARTSNSPTAVEPQPRGKSRRRAVDKENARSIQ